MSGNDLFVVGGIVFDPSQQMRSKINVLVRGGRISEFTKSTKAPEGVATFDARGALVCPGFMDIHVHLRDPGQEYKEDIFSGCEAAAAGGFTAIACMANTDPVNDNATVTRYILERAAAANGVRVYPIGSVTRGLLGKELSDIGDMHAAGAVGISDDGVAIKNPQVMRSALEYARDFDIPVIVHAEDPALSADTVMHEGLYSTKLGLRGRPREAEDIIVQRDIALARLTDHWVHIQHLSSGNSVELIRRAKAEKIKVTCEVSPHHALLTDAAMVGYDPNFKMNPPLRAESDRAALRAGLKDGTVDAFATDHAPHAATEKEEMPIETASCGIIGLECAVPLTYKLVEEKVISKQRFVELWTTGPAGVIGLPHGRLTVGCAADITIFDPEKKVTIRKNEFKSKSRNCPFDGWKCSGKIIATIVDGRVIFQS